MSKVYPIYAREGLNFYPPDPQLVEWLRRRLLEREVMGSSHAPSINGSPGFVTSNTPHGPHLVQLPSGLGTDIDCKLRAVALHLTVAENQKLVPYRSQFVIAPPNSGTQHVLRPHLCIRWTYDMYVPPSGIRLGYWH
jgi:hypothetical protein